SDIGLTGLAAFIEGLEALGYQPEITDSPNRRIAFAYEVQSGRVLGDTYRLGLEVPQGFPFTPPGGPHMKAELHRTGQSGGHPTANIHESVFGAGWQYWSRPFPDWAQSKKTVAIFMAHIYRLWDSQ